MDWSTYYGNFWIPALQSYRSAFLLDSYRANYLSVFAETQERRIGIEEEIKLTATVITKNGQ